MNEFDKLYNFRFYNINIVIFFFSINIGKYIKHICNLIKKTFNLIEKWKIKLFN